MIPADPPGIPTSGPNSDPDPRSARVPPPRVPPPQVPASQEPAPPADPPHTLIVADVLGHLIEKFLDDTVNLSPKPILDRNGNSRLPALDNHGMGTIFEARAGPRARCASAPTTRRSK